MIDECMRLASIKNGTIQQQNRLPAVELADLTVQNTFIPTLIQITFEIGILLHEISCEEFVMELTS